MVFIKLQIPSISAFLLTWPSLSALCGFLVPLEITQRQFQSTELRMLVLFESQRQYPSVSPGSICLLFPAPPCASQERPRRGNSARLLLPVSGQLQLDVLPSSAAPQSATRAFAIKTGSGLRLPMAPPLSDEIIRHDLLQRRLRVARQSGAKSAGVKTSPGISIEIARSSGTRSRAEKADGVRMSAKAGKERRT